MLIEFASAARTAGSFWASIGVVGGVVLLVLLLVFIVSPLEKNKTLSFIFAVLGACCALWFSYATTYGRFAEMRINPHLEVSLTYFGLHPRTEFVRVDDIDTVAYVSSGKGSAPSCIISVTTKSGQNHRSQGKSMSRQACRYLHANISTALSKASPEEDSWEFLIVLIIASGALGAWLLFFTSGGTTYRGRGTDQATEREVERIANMQRAIDVEIAERKAAREKPHER